MFTFDIAKLEKEIKDGFVGKRQHPTNPNLFILNYTHKCTCEWRWNKTTIHCRGTIIDSNYNVLWKPFAKFFTLDQYRTLRNRGYELYGVKYKDLFSGPYRIEEKLDGSLGILYYDGNKWSVASRGSFDSEQAIHATKIWDKKYSHIEPDPSLTYIVEIIYPENRIIVDYGSLDDIFLIDVLETHTGKSVVDICGENSKYNLWNELGIPLSFDGSVESLLETDYSYKSANDEEGYVVKYDSGIYLKVKSPEYVKVANILSHITKDYIFENLINNTWQEELSNLSKILPITIYVELYKKFEYYVEQYTKIEQQIKDIVDYNIWLNAKDFGLKFHNHPLRGPIFAYRKKKDYQQVIWKYIKNNYKEDDNNENSNK